MATDLFYAFAYVLGNGTIVTQGGKGGFTSIARTGLGVYLCAVDMTSVQFEPLALFATITGAIPGGAGFDGFFVVGPSLAFEVRTSTPAGALVDADFFVGWKGRGDPEGPVNGQAYQAAADVFLAGPGGFNFSDGFNAPVVKNAVGNCTLELSRPDPQTSRTITVNPWAGTVPPEQARISANFIDVDHVQMLASNTAAVPTLIDQSFVVAMGRKTVGQV